MAGHAPILAERVPYFRDPEMTGRIAGSQKKGVAIERFDHDWGQWTKSGAPRPSDDAIRKFLANWKRSGSMEKPRAEERPRVGLAP